ncbi:MAG: 3'(2'),5'-bisphosphate nucleotidase CysQ [Parvularculaceae bacterium]
MTPPTGDADLLDAIAELAREAGGAILEIHAGGVEVRHKQDDSPVTAADRRAEEIILKGLASIAPNVPVLAEESASDGNIPELGDKFFLVDPLDGTREFIRGDGEFTVNIALVRDRRPVLGVVYAPALGKLYAGSNGAGAWRREYAQDPAARPLGDKTPIAARARPSKGMTAVASRSHRSSETDDFLKTLDIAEFAAAGSSVKFCRIAEGAADIYPRFGRTMEWDTGAGQAVLEAAGGCVVERHSGGSLVYGKAERGFDNPHFIAWGRPPED